MSSITPPLSLGERTSMVIDLLSWCCLTGVLGVLWGGVLGMTSMWSSPPDRLQLTPLSSESYDTTEDRPDESRLPWDLVRRAAVVCADLTAAEDMTIRALSITGTCWGNTKHDTMSSHVYSCNLRDTGVVDMIRSFTSDLQNFFDYSCLMAIQPTSGFKIAKIKTMWTHRKKQLQLNDLFYYWTLDHWPICISCLISFFVEPRNKALGSGS